MDISEIIKLASGFVGGVITLYIFVKTAGKAEKKEQTDCLDKIRVDIGEHGLHIMTGQQNHEKLADSMEQRFKHLENKVNQFDAIVPEVQALKIEMKGYTVKIDNLIDAIKDSKTEHKESVREIKDMIRAQHS